MNPSYLTDPNAMFSDTSQQVPTTQSALVAATGNSASTQTAVATANAATGAAETASSAASVPASVATVAVNPSEPLLLPADFIAGAAGLLLSGTRSAFWGLALLDIIGRQVSATYRQYAYQYVHVPLAGMLPASLGLSGLGRPTGTMSTRQAGCPPGYTRQPEVKYTNVGGVTSPGQWTGRMTCQPTPGLLTPLGPGLTNPWG